MNDTIPPVDKKVDEFLADAIGRRLNRGELTDLLAFGKRHARARGLMPRDTEEAIAAERRGGKQRGYSPA